MRALLILTATVALAACNNKPAEAPATNDMAMNADANMAMDNMAMDNMADANMAAPMALAAITETSREFTDAKTKKPIQESVDAAGKYIAVSGKEHIDHGTAVMKSGKACFTSAMDKEGEVCWTDPMLAEGTSGETTSDKGEKLTVKRVAYTPLSM